MDSSRVDEFKWTADSEVSPFGFPFPARKPIAFSGKAWRFDGCPDKRRAVRGVPVESVRVAHSDVLPESATGLMLTDASRGFLKEELGLMLV